MFEFKTAQFIDKTVLNSQGHSGGGWGAGGGGTLGQDARHGGQGG